MQVILLERVSKLGQMGDVVDVKPGFARNFLLPQGKALTASENNVAAFEGRKTQLQADNLESKREAEAMAKRLDGQKFVVIRQASDAGALYGSVTTRDAAEAAVEGGFAVERRQVALRTPIKELGLHDVSVVLHPRGRGDDHAERRPAPRRRQSCNRRASRSRSSPPRRRRRPSSRFPSSLTTSAPPRPTTTWSSRRPERESGSDDDQPRI